MTGKNGTIMMKVKDLKIIIAETTTYDRYNDDALEAAQDISFCPSQLRCFHTPFYVLRTLLLYGPGRNAPCPKPPRTLMVRIKSVKIA